LRFVVEESGPTARSFLRTHRGREGEIMTNRKATKNRVYAQYEDSAVLFDLPENATLEQLCEMLVTLGQGHGRPVRVDVAVRGARG
jgi:hypothetical protein